MKACSSDAGMDDGFLLLIFCETSLAIWITMGNGSFYQRRLSVEHRDSFIINQLRSRRGITYGSNRMIRVLYRWRLGRYI